MPVIKRLSHLPVIVDPSHASGLSWLVEPLAMAAAAVGATASSSRCTTTPATPCATGPSPSPPPSLTGWQKVEAVSGLVSTHVSAPGGPGSPKRSSLWGWAHRRLPAKALTQNTPHQVLGMDIDDDSLLDACSCGAIRGKAGPEDLKDADLIYLCVYPRPPWTL